MWSQVLSGPASKKTTPPQRSVRAMAAKAVLLQLLQSVFQVVEICRARILRFLSKSFHIFWSHSPWSNSYNSPNESKQCAGAGGIGRIHWIHWGSTFRLKDRENEWKKERKKERKEERKKERERTKWTKWTNQYNPVLQCVACIECHVFVVYKSDQSTWCVVRYLWWKHDEARLLGLVGNALLTKADEGFPGIVWKSKRWQAVASIVPFDFYEL